MDLFECAAGVGFMPMSWAYLKANSCRFMAGKTKSQCGFILKDKLKISGAGLKRQHFR